MSLIRAASIKPRKLPVPLTRKSSSSTTTEVGPRSGNGPWIRSRWHTTGSFSWTLTKFLLRNSPKKFGKPSRIPCYNGYYLALRMHFLGRVLRHGNASFHKLSLFRRGKARFECRLQHQDASMCDMEVHEHVVVEGQTAKLRKPLVHRNLESLSHYIRKHDEYSNWEAGVWLQGDSSYRDLPPVVGRYPGTAPPLAETILSESAGFAFSVLSVQVFLAPRISGWCSRTDLLRIPGHPVFSHQSEDLRTAHAEGAMSATRTEFARCGRLSRLSGG